MQALRQAAFLARLVLAWFALSLGVAIAAPIVNPQAVELICSAGGAVKMVVKGDPGKAGGTQTPSGSHTLDCPLCSIAGAPPLADAGLTHATAASQIAQSSVAASVTVQRIESPPARGPPSRQVI